MNKEIYKLELNCKIDSLVVTDKTDGEIVINNTIKIGTSHNQDCCESVYGDFSVTNYFKEKVVGKEVKDIIIKSVEGMGFLLCFEIAYKNSEKVFIPCYNYQNGYYSSNLDLLIEKDGVRTTIDISNLVEDHID